MKKRKDEFIATAKLTLFFAVLFAIGTVGLMWFLRPSVSEMEKRELTKFPEFSPSALVDGSFCRELDVWYADTFPSREFFVSMSAGMHSLFGDRSQQIINNGEAGDNIPDDIPDDIPDPVEPSGTEPPSPPVTDAQGTDVPGTDVPGTDAAVTDSPETEPPVTEPPATEPPATEPPEPPVTDQNGEMAGSLYLSGNSAYGLYYFKKARVDVFADVMNKTYSAIGGRTKMWCIVAPLSSGVLLGDAVIEKLGASDQGRAIEYAYSVMNSGIGKISAYDALVPHRDEYIYFRTDHHWTALGAYYTYRAFAKAKGMTPHELSDFETRTFEGFLGTYYTSSRSGKLAATPDTVTAYVPMGTNSMKYRAKDGSEVKWNIVRNVDSYGASVKYSCFAGADQSYAEAHNPNITDGSACIVVKDSFGNAFIPFLIDHYEHVYWIDFRYYKESLSDLVGKTGASDVIYIVNIYNISSSGNVSKMASLVE